MADAAGLANHTFDELRPGLEDRIEHVVTAVDLEAWSTLADGAAPGLAAGALVAALIGRRLPGAGSVLRRQSFSFEAPVRPGDRLTISATVRSRASGGVVLLDCRCTNQLGLTVLEGEVEVLAPERRRRAPELPEPVPAPRRHEKYERLVALTREITAMPTVVAHPCDETSLRAAVEAAAAGIIEPVLVAPLGKLRAIAAASGLSLEGIELVDAPHSHAAAEKAVELVRAGRGELLMKGSLHSDELLSAVTARETGLRTERRLSHIFIMDVPTYPEPLFITDAAVNIFPDLEAKRDIVQNAIDLHRGLGLGEPRVAILSAVETVTPKIPGTIDAAALCKMADRGQIEGGLLDGPLALDNAISLEAARMKKIRSKVAGRAQILVVPDLEAGNMLAKNLSFLAGADAAGVVLGARVPIVLTSRADDLRTRLASCAVAALYANHRRGHRPVAAE
ncbi:bifunctional enoyl-CoA hydratase/phosphate acetyltransferase [Geminicoccaceae bacterium 1502E]|nr:bifunctional enoyl-CoA hydratase/phosphate acetyltransferase [Geminicoccaceae bacterium 1502E]